MKIFLISQKVNNDYDTYDAAIVTAPEAEIARDMHPGRGELIDWEALPDYVRRTWAPRREDVAVEQVGVATDGAVKAVILLSSFNAG